jgi:hypothetical protein
MVGSHKARPARRKPRSASLESERAEAAVAAGFWLAALS